MPRCFGLETTWHWLRQLLLLVASSSLEFLPVLLLSIQKRKSSGNISNMLGELFTSIMHKVFKIKKNN